MYPRHRIDIRPRDLAYALAACLTARRGDELAPAVERRVAPSDDAIACLSVRSGFELLLGALDLPAGSEVLVSAVTHPDMVGILELHGLRPVPVDLDVETLEPRSDLLGAAVTEQTRMILVAHLFGRTADLAPAAEVARRHGLLLVEDCAQSLASADVRGDSRADVSMFSFGPIKTATALGGGILRVRDPELRRRMRGHLASWPAQPRAEFFMRAARFVAIAVLARPIVFGLFARACTLLGRDLDRLLGSFVRGLKVAYDDPAFLRRIRRRPSAPLLELVLRRLTRFDAERLARRAWIGEELARSLPPSALHPGRAGAPGTHWVFPVVVADPPAFVAALRERGFDAAPARAMSAIAVVPPEPSAAAWLMSQVVFLPSYPDLPDRAVRRLVASVGAALEAAPSAPREAVVPVPPS